MAKNFVTGPRVVNFVCRAFNYHAYSVYNRDTAETIEMRRWDDGRITRGAGGIDAEPADVAAVEAFRAAEDQEFVQWAQAKGLQPKCFCSKFARWNSEEGWWECEYCNVVDLRVSG